MAQVQDVGKLRQVLDYWSCDECLDHFTPEQDYLCGICAKLNREITVKQTVMARDEAVQVIAPEDFHMARSLRDRVQAQELELQESRARVKKLTGHEEELEERLEELQKKLESTKKEKEAAALVPFELVGIKETAPPEEEEIFEFQEEPPEPAPAAEGETQWETVPETEPVPEGEEPQTFQPGPAPGAEPAPAAEAPAVPEPVKQRVKATDDAIAKIEDEITKIESELTQLADQEKELQKKGHAAPAAKKKRRRAA